MSRFAQASRPATIAVRAHAVASRARRLRTSGRRLIALIRDRPWLAVVVGGYVVVNLALLTIRPADATMDWELWSALPNALETGSLYEPIARVPFLWSPLLAPVMVGFAAAPWLLTLLHALAIALLRSPVLIGLTVVSYAFWSDMGNLFTFGFVAGVLAWRGSNAAALVFMGLLLLMPRPVQMPLAVLLLLRMPAIRLPFVGIAIAHALLVLATGLGPAWISAMVGYGGGASYDIGLSHTIGLWWLVIGIPLALLLTYSQRPGLAGVMLSPYLLPQYLLMPLIDQPMVRSRRRRSTAPLDTSGVPPLEGTAGLELLTTSLLRGDNRYIGRQRQRNQRADRGAPLR